MTKHYRLKISYDDQPSDPREDENLGTIWCWDRDRTGDERDSGTNDPQQAKQLLVERHVPNFATLWEKEWSPRFDDLWARHTQHDTPAYNRDFRELRAEESEALDKKFEEYYFWLPVYMYSHSGVCIATTPFSCRFDSGQIGFTFVDKKKAADWHIDDEKVLDALNGEVEHYSAYLEGQAYGYVLQEHSWPYEDPGYAPGDDDEGWTELDACWGFLGDDCKTSGILGNLGKKWADAVGLAEHKIGEWVRVTPKETDATT